MTGYYAHHSGGQIAGFAVLLAGCALLLVYTTTATRSPVARASGLAAGNALWAATAFTVELDPSYLPLRLLAPPARGRGVDRDRQRVGARDPVRRRRLVGTREPRWLRVLGGAAILGLAAAYWYVPLAAFLAWIVAESLGAAVASRAARSARTPS